MKDGKQKKLRDNKKIKPSHFPLSIKQVRKGVIRQQSKSKLKETLWRIITAYDAGRKMDLGQNLNYELINVPVAIADSNGYLQSGNKSILTQVLFSNVECPVVITPKTAN